MALFGNARQVFTYQLEVVKGWYDQDHSLDKQRKLSANVSFNFMPAGRCLHLNSAGEFETGVTGWAMPFFNLKSSDSPSVSNAEGGNQTVTGWIGVMPSSPVLNCLAAEGAIEVETTEYDADQTYEYNEPLRAPTHNDVFETGGLITNQGVVHYASATPQSATAVVGVVSNPPYQAQSDRGAKLGFYPRHIPGAAGL